VTRNTPAYWPQKRLKYAVRLHRSRARGDNDERRYIGLEHIEPGTGRLVDVPVLRADGVDSSGGSGESLCGCFEEGDVLFGKLRPYLAKAWIASFSGRCTTELLVMQPKDFERRFLLYVLLSKEFVDSVDASTFGSKMPRADWDFIGNLSVSIPSIRQQRAVADYLDRESARLDALIRAKETPLDLLAEKRRALITRAATRGLDPHPLLRASGHPGLEKLPAHWKLERLRWLIQSLQQGWSPEAEDRQPDEDGWGVLKLNAVNRGLFDPGKLKALPVGLPAPPDLQVQQGDFLITWSNTPGLVGDVCFVKESPPRIILCDLIYRLRLDEHRIDGTFLSYFLLSPIGRRQIEGNARGTSNSMVKLSQEHIKNWWLPVPSLSEQQAIVESTTKELSKLDSLRAVAERTISLLNERRAALIAAAVTGQLNIPEAV
jgi:type I restriction enzyme S subunit